MINGNGRPPIRFPQPSAIPLVGQPFTLKGFFPTVVIKCNCEHGDVITLVGASISVCPACQKGYIIGSVSFRQDQPEQAQIGVGIVRQDAPAGQPAGAAS